MEEGSEEEDAQIRVHVKYKIQIKRKKILKKPWVPPEEKENKKKKETQQN